MAAPTAEMTMLNMRHDVMAWRRMRRARACSDAPMLWATCTEKPVVTAEQMPQKSHSEVETRPTEAELSAPSRPTMAASIYCIIIDDNWAIMAGHDSFSVSASR